jgi:MFS family permease
LAIMANPFLVMRSPGVVRLWLVGIAVGVIRWLELLALALFVLEMSGSPFLVALTTVLRMLPLLLLSMPIASLAETRDRRRLLLMGLAGMLLGSALLFLLALFDLVGVWLLLLAAFASGAFWTLEQTVRRAMLAEAGGYSRIGASMGVEVATNQLTRFIGVVAGGAVVEFVGLAGVFAAGILLYGWGSLLVLGVPAAPEPTVKIAPRPWREALIEGMRFARRAPVLLGTAAVTIVFNLFGFPYIALAPIVGEQALGLAPTAIGLLLGMEAVGGLLASLLIATVARREHYTRIFVSGPVLFLAMTLAFASTHSVPLAFSALFLVGFGVAAFASMQATIPLSTARPEMRVRALGIINMSIGVSPLGFLHAGLMGELVGASAAIALISLEGLLAIALVLRAWPDLLRALPERPE